MSESELDVEEVAAAVRDKLVPTKSRIRYETAYNNFMTWMQKKKVKEIKENTLLAYFSKELDKYAASTRWSIYSMLRMMINMNHGIDIDKFSNLTPYK